MNTKLVSIFAQYGLFYSFSMELRFDALHGPRDFVGDPPVHSHMASEGTLSLLTMSFQYSAQRRYLSCLRISLNITGCFLFMSDVLACHSCGILRGWAVQHECVLSTCCLACLFWSEPFSVQHINEEELKVLICCQDRWTPGASGGWNSNLRYIPAYLFV